MKNLYKVLVSTVFITTFGFGQFEIQTGSTHTIIKKGDNNSNYQILAFGNNGVYASTAFTANQKLRSAWGNEYPYIKTVEPVVITSNDSIIGINNVDWISGGGSSSFFGQTTSENYGYGSNSAGQIGIGSD